MSLNQQEIKELKERVKKLTSLLNQISQKANELKTQNRSELSHKEQELESWREKLEVLQQERKLIEKQKREKVLELEQSQLSNTEKQAKINQLLTEHSTELEELDNLIYEERAQYRAIRDKLINKLCEDCALCQQKTKDIQNRDNKIEYLFITIWILAVLFLIGSIFATYLLNKLINQRKSHNLNH